MPKRILAQVSTRLFPVQSSLPVHAAQPNRTMKAPVIAIVGEKRLIWPLFTKFRSSHKVNPMPTTPPTIKSSETNFNPSETLIRSSLLISFLFHIELPAKKLRRRPVPSYPILPKQKIVDLVRKNKLLELHVLPAQPLNQVGGLPEGHIAVIIAVDQQHRREIGRAHV